MLIQLVEYTWHFELCACAPCVDDMTFMYADVYTTEKIKHAPSNVNNHMTQCFHILPVYIEGLFF